MDVKLEEMFSQAEKESQIKGSTKAWSLYKQIIKELESHHEMTNEEKRIYVESCIGAFFSSGISDYECSNKATKAGKEYIKKNICDYEVIRDYMFLLWISLQYEKLYETAKEFYQCSDLGTKEIGLEYLANGEIYTEGLMTYDELKQYIEEYLAVSSNEEVKKRILNNMKYY